MIGLDTNVLIRYLTQDDPRQARIANDIIDRRLSAERPGFISVVTAAETAWVLRTYFKATKLEAAEAIEGLISQDTVVVESVDDVVQAIEDVRGLNADFADALISALGRRAGCQATLTFDRDAARLPGFQLAR